jgi:hypothetical protein
MIYNYPKYEGVYNPQRNRQDVLDCINKLILFCRENPYEFQNLENDLTDLEENIISEE